MYSINNMEDLKSAYRTLMRLEKENGTEYSKAINLLKNKIRIFNRKENAKEEQTDDPGLWKVGLHYTGRTAAYMCGHA